MPKFPQGVNPKSKNLTGDGAPLDEEVHRRRCYFGPQVRSGFQLRHSTYSPLCSPLEKLKCGIRSRSRLSCGHSPEQLSPEELKSTTWTVSYRASRRFRSVP